MVEDHHQSQEEIRKGPWTEQEDFQLVCFVGLFGDRRWDFIAKVSGLNRTGKSCRLRWVNYLHPGLKRGKMTPHEERLVLELHAKWGNRWSRIARKLPGRTDNEIKNYWRTHMRKKAQEIKKRAAANTNNNNPPRPPPSPSSSSSTSTDNSKSSSSSSSITTVESLPFLEATTGVESFYDTGGRPAAEEEGGSCYSMDDIWKEISLPDVNAMSMTMDPLAETMLELEGNNSQDNFVCNDVVQEMDQFYCSDSLWKMDDDEASKPITTFVNNAYDTAFSAGFGASEETILTSGS